MFQGYDEGRCLLCFLLVHSLWCSAHKASLHCLVKQRQLEGKWDCMLHIYSCLLFIANTHLSDGNYYVSILFRVIKMMHCQGALSKLKSRTFSTLTLCPTPALSVEEQVQTLPLGSPGSTALSGNMVQAFYHFPFRGCDRLKNIEILYLPITCIVGS